MHVLTAKQKLRQSSNKKRILINSLIIPVAIIQPLMTVPQIVAVFTNKSARDVSIATWITFDVASIFWFYYGLVHRERAIIITQSLWLIVQTTLILGILLYK